MNSTEVPEARCASCDKPLDTATHPIGEFDTPSPGDVSVCLYCGNLSIFTSDLRLRKPSEQEMNEITRDPLVMKMQDVIPIVMKGSKH